MVDFPSIIARLPSSARTITSQINLAATPQDIVCALADGAAELVTFDYCSLVVCGPGSRTIRVWRAPNGSGLACSVAQIEEYDDGHSWLSELISRAERRLVSQPELWDFAAGYFGREVNAAQVFPLSMSGDCFGLLCFAGTDAESYADEGSSSLMWLADHVAAVVRALQYRAQAANPVETQREIERLKSGFVNTLVRDIRVPMASVFGLLELFESKIQARESFDLEDRHLLNSALEHGDRMRHLVDDLLEATRQHDHPITLHPETVEAEQILEETAEPLRGEAALRGVDLHVREITPGLRLRVDPRQTRRALCHLLTAALSATPDGGTIEITAREILGTRTGDEGKRFVVMSVADSSNGIPAEEVPFIFDAFWQAADARTNMGRSVGLSIAKRVAAAHGGNVSVRSQLGKGTIYSIILPSLQPETSRTRQRILIVDDAPELLLLLRKLVARMGYEVEIANGSAEALEILRGTQVDLLLTDWAMPGMNGGELIAALRKDERFSGLPVVVLTGHDTGVERNDAQTVGCDRFLVKPVKRGELRRVFEELLPVTPAGETWAEESA